MRHFLFGKDLYHNLLSHIRPILSYFDFFQVGFSIKLMLPFFNQNFIRIIITFKRQVIHTPGLQILLARFTTKLLFLLYATFTRDGVCNAWLTRIVCHPGMLFYLKKKSWWVLLLQFSLSNPELRNYYNSEKSLPNYCKKTEKLAPIKMLVFPCIFSIKAGKKHSGLFHSGEFTFFFR